MVASTPAAHNQNPINNSSIATAMTVPQLPFVEPLPNTWLRAECITVVVISSSQQPREVRPHSINKGCEAQKG